MLRAADEGSLPFATVQQYVAAGVHARQRMSTTPSLGGKLLDELDRLLMAPSMVSSDHLPVNETIKLRA